MDFYRIVARRDKSGNIDVFPDFKVGRSKDLMLRGKSFYAIWDEAKGLWSTDEYDVQRLVDEDLYQYAQEHHPEANVKYMSNFSSNSWIMFRRFLNNMSDSSTQLDEHLTFANSEVRKENYVSRRLPYALEAGPTPAWDEILNTLYAEEERAKIEWAIGAIVSGDARTIQKFLVLYGPGGTGKSTILNIVQKLFEGYYTTFEAKALAGNNNAFSTEVFKSNPLVAIQHDGDLSKIEDNTKLNSIISHEDMTLNEKYKPSYMAKINAFLLMGTNKPVKITDAKSGIIRRLIDVVPTGNLLPPKRYQALMGQIDFELGHIAQHCLDTYLSMGRDFYSGYKPLEMMLQTDVFFNFIEANFDIFKQQDGTTLKQAYELYKTYCEETNVDWKLPQYKFREELRNYFDTFHDRWEMPDGTRVRSWFAGFNADHFKTKTRDDGVFALVMEESTSLFDVDYASQPAQLATVNETPKLPWAQVTTTLGDIDTSQIHYVKVPESHIVIDFDLKDSDGRKSIERNLEAASKWPPTYAEFSKSGGGIHLHYIYGGEAADLARAYDDGIEVKVFTGGSSLRRKLTKCNAVPIATLTEGTLPVRERKVLDSKQVQSEKALRDLISRNLRKEVHPGTKPSVSFIHTILDEAYKSGMSYDVSDMRSKILAFANNSTNHALYCLKLVQTMQFKSEDVLEAKATLPKDEKLVFFDVEVYKNLFVICWKFQGAKSVVKMINPTPQQVEELFALKLVGFNNRRYDNHILYARYMGFSNIELYNLSQKIIEGNRNAFFGAAYNLSYTDIYDFASVKMGLKKWEVELGIKHMEMAIPWDQPVEEKDIPKVVEYCANDVNATEAVFEARKEDFVARQILADLSGLSLNATTQQHTARIVFGDDKKPQEQFVYTDLAEMFPGYKYEYGKSTYREEITGEGGYVYAEPGMYENVALLDVASMHPTSIEQLDLFGPYTKHFSALKAARIAIKHKDFDKAKQMLGGKLARHLTDEETASALSYALKIVINIVYGLTSAKFDNAFRDPRNIDNIVAKRGALFMIDLKHLVQERGFTVAHIKTDSIKIPNATPEIIQEVFEFGKKYGYDFEHEATYDKFCLVNDAVYVAKTGDKWSATGAQFQHPFVFKTIFTKEEIEFRDMCEARSVQKGAIYLDFEGEDGKEPFFVGKTGVFTPVKPGAGGGVLLRINEDKQYAVAGTKGYLWLESEMVESLDKQDDIDMEFFYRLVDDAKETLSKYAPDLDWFTS